MQRFIHIAGLSNIIYGSGFFLFWVFYSLLLPFSPLEQSIVPMVSDPDWVWINSLGTFSSIFGMIGLSGMFFLQLPRNRFFGLTGFILAIFGLTIKAGEFLWEGYLFRIIARSEPAMLSIEGPVYSNSFLMSLIIVGGLCFSIGYFIFGFACRSCNDLPTWGIQFIIIGAPLFGLSPLFGPLQEVFNMTGVILFATGLIMTGSRMIGLKET